MELTPGTVIDGKYRIERKLGEGGMGAVFAARHIQLGELVALKVMLAAEDTNALSRFDREARAASLLQSEYVVRVLDAGRADDGAPYIVLQYIDGSDLMQVTRARGRLSVTDAVEAIVQACEGVAEAHALGMVHRDLSLKNMLLTQRADGTTIVKILDFGVVKITGKSDDQPTLTLTENHVLIGSAHYMGPEQIAMSSKVDARADVWALGVCLYKLLTGTLPFKGETLGEILTAITRDEPKPVREIRPEVSAAISDAVERALEKTLSRRFQNVAELAGVLGPEIGDPLAGERIKAVLSGGLATNPVSPRLRAKASAPPAHTVTSKWSDLRTATVMSEVVSQEVTATIPLDTVPAMHAAQPAAPPPQGSRARSVVVEGVAPPPPPVSPRNVQRPYAIAPEATGVPAVEQRRSAVPFALGGIVIAGLLAALVVSRGQRLGVSEPSTSPVLDVVDAGTTVLGATAPVTSVERGLAVAPSDRPVASAEGAPGLRDAGPPGKHLQGGAAKKKAVSGEKARAKPSSDVPGPYDTF